MMSTYLLKFRRHRRFATDIEFRQARNDGKVLARGFRRYLDYFMLAGDKSRQGEARRDARVMTWPCNYVIGIALLRTIGI